MPCQPKTGEQPVAPKPYDGTFAGLIAAYRTHEKSPYQQLKHKVRVSYDNGLDRLVSEVGSERVIDWSADRIKAIYGENWAADGKISMGHSMIGKLRLVSRFGAVVLNDDASIRLNAILGSMRFAATKRRTALLTRDHARAVRITAHEHFGWSSIALAQALKFECPKLRQTDIIGEWVPIGEPGTSDITKDDQKWLHGLRWSDIDDNMILRRELTTGRQNQRKMVELNLRRFAMVMEEINRIPLASRTGPMVVCEFSGVPWTGNEFRRKWRIVAAKAGVPFEIQFSDGKGAIEQGQESRAV
jgi:hypothetical protein